MDQLRLFGLTINVNSDGTLVPPVVSQLTGSFTGNCSAAGKASFRADLKVASKFELKFSLEVSMVKDATNQWIPADGTQVQGDSALFQLRDLTSTEDRALSLKCGPLQLASSSFSAQTIQGNGGQLFICFPDGAELIGPTNLPLGIGWNGNSGFTLDLLSPSLSFAQGAIEAYCLSTFVSMNNVGTPSPYNHFSSVLRCGTTELSLAALLTEVEFAFLSDENNPLHFHTDVLDRNANLSADNPVIAAMRADSFALTVTLGATVALVPYISRVQLKAHPNTGPVQLTAYNYGNSLNQPFAATLGSGLDLHMRVGDLTTRPATFLVAPLYPRPSNALPTSLPATILINDAFHGLISNHQFLPRPSGALVSEAPYAKAPSDLSIIPSSVSPTIVSEHTTPWLHLDADSAPALAMRHTKSGTTFRSPGDVPDAQAHNVLTYDFTGTSLGLPLLPKEGFQSAPEIQTDHYKDLNNNVYNDHRYTLAPSVHQTLLTEGPVMNGTAVDQRSVVAISKLFDLSLVQSASGDPATIAPAPTILLKQYSLIRSYGPITIQLTVPAETIPDYFVLKSDANGDPINYEFINSNFSFGLDSGDADKGSLGGWPDKSELALKVQGIVKLSTQFTLAEIFSKEGLDQSSLFGPDFLANYVDSSVLQKGWVGLVLFSLNASFLPQLVSAGTFTLQYISLTPQKQGNMSVNARLVWTNEEADAVPAETSDQESAFRMNSVDATWYDSHLISLHAEGDLQFASFFGVPYSTSGQSGNPPTLTVSGSLNKADNTIRFVGKLSEDLPLLPTDGSLSFGPIEQVYVQSAQVVLNSDQSSTFQLNGLVKLRSIDVFDLADATPVAFQGLGIHFGTPGDNLPHWAGITYPSFQLNLNISPFNLGFLELKPESFGVDFSGDASGFDWQGLADLKGDFASVKPKFRFDLSLELMKLPELALKSVDRLTLIFTVGLGLNGNKRWDASNILIRLRAVSFDNLHFDLLRFLELDCSTATFGVINGVNCLEFGGVTMRVLGKTLVDKLSLVLYSSPQGRGFLGYMPTKAITGGLIYWVIVGHNIVMPDSLAKSIMSVDAVTTAEDNAAISVDILSAVGANAFLPGPGALNGGGWVFAAGFNFFGFLQGKFLFQDHAYYGICLRGGILDELFGPGFAISVLYIKGDRPDQDSFVTSLRVPMVMEETFTFLGGVISLQIGMDGSFTLDIGFPWLGPDGGRMWDRTFGAIVTPYQGQGGSYVRRTNLSTESHEGAGLLLSGGYAIEFGLGGSFGGDTFTVWATIGLYAIVEGAVYYEYGRGLRGLRYNGVEGILGRAAGELNWWIISLRVEVVISAEIGLLLQWGRFAPLGDGSDPSGGPVKIEADFLVYVSASAQACIGVGFISICAGISITLPLRFSYQFQLKG